MKTPPMTLTQKILAAHAVGLTRPYVQAGDVLATYADVEELRRDVGFEPRTPLSEGIARWAEWFREYSARTPG